MKLPLPLAVHLSPLVEAARGRPLLEPSLEVESNDETEYVVVSERGRFVFDRQQRVVRLDEVEVSDFDSIQSIDISAFPGGRGEKSWALTLYRGFFDRILLGRTYDDGVASVTGAQLSRLLGVKVVALTLGR
jgi:hypothetical protein